jgi:endoglucanase
MTKKFHLSILFFFSFLFQAFAGLIIYKNGQKVVTGTWNGNGTIVETSSNTPFDGTEHYKFDYNFTDWWAGFGLNLDNWGSSAALNFNGNTHLRVAYRGMSGNQGFKVKLRNGTALSSLADVGPATGSYDIVDIPLSSFVGVNLGMVTEIDFEIANQQVASGAVFIDAIELVSIIVPPPPPSSAATWTRLQAMGKGFNTANWLEAYWLQPFNAYPVEKDFTRASFKALKQAGFNNVRLPVIFERMGSLISPYTLNTNQLAFRLVDSAVVWAKDLKMQLIIVNHHGYDVNDANYQTQIPRLCAVWKQLTKRYTNLDPNRYLFEIYNEPNNISNTNWRKVAQNIVDTIRVYDKSHTLVLGGNGWNSMTGLVGLQPLKDDNIIYTFHCYEPYFFTHQGMSWTNPSNFPTKSFPVGNDLNDLRTAFRAVKKWSNDNKVAVFMGEFGVSASANLTSRCNYVQALTHLSDSLNIPWTYWDVKNYTDAFGFYPNSLFSESNAISCFKKWMGLYKTPISNEDISTIYNASVYPNPVSTEDVKLTFSSDFDGEYQVRLYSNNGQIVHQQRFEVFVGENNISIPVENLSVGLYHLLLQNDKGSIRNWKIQVSF